MAFEVHYFVQTGFTGVLLLLFIVHAIVLLCHRRRSSKYNSSEAPETVAIIGAIIRGIFVVGLSIGLMYVASKVLNNNMRSAFMIPFSRFSPEAVQYNGRFLDFAPRNLLDCPHFTESATVTNICQFDKSTMILAAAIGVLAFIEALVTFATTVQGPAQRSFGDFDHGQHHELTGQHMSSGKSV
ncbi:hypothetical protein BG004_004039 [Podila humilis]|nr:hypothetical protein BG004_004039 [Podila humilis]